MNLSEHLRLIDFDAVAAAGLGAVEARVGAGERDGGIFVADELCDAGRHGNTSGLGDDEVLHVLAHALGEDARACEADVGQQDEELFAAPPHREVGSALRLREDPGDPFQHAIADRVSR